MIEFFEDYQYEIIYIIVTIISVVALRFLTTFIQKRALKRSVEKLHYQSDGTLKTVRRILNTLWLVLGIIAIASLFVSPEVNKTLIDNSKFIIYRDRKSTRLNSSHVRISYAVFCLKKKTK